MVKKPLMLLVIVAAVLIAVPKLLVAQQDAGQGKKGQDVTGQQTDQTSQKAVQKKAVKEGPYRVTSVLNKKVTTEQGDGIGTITDLVAGYDGNLKYAILDHGGFLGIGNKLIPIPWEAVKRGPDKDTFIVNVTKATLEKAPTFEPKKWPDFATPEWDATMSEYYVLRKDGNK